FLFERHKHALHRIFWFSRGWFSSCRRNRVCISGSGCCSGRLCCLPISCLCAFAVSVSVFCGSLLVSHFLLFVVECGRNLKIDRGSEAVIQLAINFSSDCGWKVMATVGSLRNYDNSESRIREWSI